MRVGPVHELDEDPLGPLDIVGTGLVPGPFLQDRDASSLQALS